MRIYVEIEDIRHGDHFHCLEGIRRFCTRTGIDCDDLLAGKITAEELEATGQHMGIEVARNARERAWAVQEKAEAAAKQP